MILQKRQLAKCLEQTIRIHIFISRDVLLCRHDIEGESLVCGDFYQVKVFISSEPAISGAVFGDIPGDILTL